jgi:nucleoside 2-deoxyribosyltransferase
VTLRKQPESLRASQSALGYAGFVARLDRVLANPDDELLHKTQLLQIQMLMFNGRAYRLLDDVLEKARQERIYMNIYLAARFIRADELLEYARDLEAMGHCITSRWIRENHKASDAKLIMGKARQFAMEDQWDISISDCMISFTEPPHFDASRGGRHVEFGYGLAHNKRMIVVGYRENVFHSLPGVEFYPDWATTKDVLEKAREE